MFKICKTKVGYDVTQNSKKENEKRTRYAIDEEYMDKFLETLTHHYTDIDHLYKRDYATYLRGVADTMPNGFEIKRIADYLERMTIDLSRAIYVQDLDTDK